MHIFVYMYVSGGREEREEVIPGFAMPSLVFVFFTRVF